jgi:putative ABC transport system permease protein
MKYLHLIWAALFRRKTRTILTLLSIIMAFLLFGMLDAVRISFAEAGQSANGAERLQTGARLSFIQTLPKSLTEKIAAVPGVKDVAFANWFGGAYQDPHNQVFTFAVSDNYLDVYPEVIVSAEDRKAFADDLNGILAGEMLIKKYGWKIGDTIPAAVADLPQPGRQQELEFQAGRGNEFQRWQSISKWHDHLALEEVRRDHALQPG